MDDREPDQTPFAAVSAQTSRFSRVSCLPGRNCRWCPIVLTPILMGRAVIPKLSGQIHPVHSIPLGHHRRPFYRLFPPHPPHSGLVHRLVDSFAYRYRRPSSDFASLLLPRDLPPESFPRLSPTQIRSVARPRRRPGRRPEQFTNEAR